MLPPNRGDYERVAVVGAGVAGLTVAHDLAQLGYKVTVFEAYSTPGGMLTAGVPVFRLPRELVMAEINAILSLGVELKCNQRLGRDFTIASLRAQGYKAIFLGVGLPKGRKLDLPGADLNGVYDGMDFLRAFNEGNPLPVGKRIIVIGGGNVAYDVARSAVRPLEPHGATTTVADMQRGESMAYDVARSAMRMSGDKEVHVVCLESRARDAGRRDRSDRGRGRRAGPAQLARATRDRGRERQGGRPAHRGVRCGLRRAAAASTPASTKTTSKTIAADTIIFSIGQIFGSFLSAAGRRRGVRIAG